MTERSVPLSPYGLEGVDPGQVGVPKHQVPALSPRPYESAEGPSEDSTGKSEPTDPRENCDRIMITPFPAEEKPRGRQRTRHGFAI